MKKIVSFCTVVVFFTCHIAAQQALPLTQKIIEQLKTIDSFSAKTTFNVTLPMTDEEAKYELDINYKKNDKDSLLGINYYIDIRSVSNKDINNSFIMYSNGNLYHYTGQKLKEYHYTEDKTPFEKKIIEDRTLYGVERSGLFYNDLPYAIAEDLERKKASPNIRIEEHPNMRSEGKIINQLRITEIWKGDVLKVTEVSFDNATGFPLYKQVENNPGNIGSQTVTTRYFDIKTNIDFESDYFTESRLNREKADIMTMMRESNYQAYSLKGKKIPRFSLPVPVDNKRCSNDDLIGNKTILVFADTVSSFCKTALDDLNQLMHKDGFGNVKFLVLYKEKEIPLLQNERNINYLYSVPDAQNTALSFGVTGFPTIFVIAPDGYVREVIVGYSRELKNKIEQVIIN